jgi:hypothetical protein
VVCNNQLTSEKNPIPHDSNVHGVYKPGNVVLRPELLGKHQAYAREQLKGEGGDKPL